MGYTERIKKRGFWQKGIFDVVHYLVDDFASTLTKLDADGTVTGTDFVSTLGIAAYCTAAGINTIVIGDTYDATVRPNGIPQGKFVELLKFLRTNFNLLMDKCAADGTVNGTTAFTNLKFSTTYLIDVSNARVKKHGEHRMDWSIS